MNRIYIKGMKMPKDCESFSFCDYEQANRLAANDRNTLPHSFEQRPVWCPLIPVPDHGRLIDADELHSALRKRAKEFSNSEYGEGVKCGLADAREYIKIAPTIIPEDPDEGGDVQ